MNEYETIPTRVKAWQAPVDCTIKQETIPYEAGKDMSLRVGAGFWVVDFGRPRFIGHSRYEVLSDEEFTRKYRPVEKPHYTLRQIPQVWPIPSRPNDWCDIPGAPGGPPTITCEWNETPVGRTPPVVSPPQNEGARP